MEEDTCKQLHLSTYTLLDYNRAGIPLVEIVSKPEMHTGEEARKYVEKIRELVTFAGVSDGKMEEGSLRCDVNVSIRPYGQEKFGTKVEIKNLNSIANVERAIDFEIKRQSELILLGKSVQQETRRFDETKKETVLMRVKTDAADYKYFTEPNIMPIRISEEFVQDAIDTCPELHDAKVARFLNDYKLDSTDIEILLNNLSFAAYFEKVASFTKNYQAAANFLISDVTGYINKANISIDEFKVDPKYIAELIDLLQAQQISSTQGKQVFAKLVETNVAPSKIKEELGFTLISNEGEIEEIIEQVIAGNPTLIDDFKAGKSRVQGFIVGQVMKQTHGKANPAVASKLAIKVLNSK